VDCHQHRLVARACARPSHRGLARLGHPDSRRSLPQCVSPRASLSGA
jgi:hypothetical protein